MKLKFRSDETRRAAFLLLACFVALLGCRSTHDSSSHTVADDWTPLVAQPEFPQGGGPVVLIDAAHGNWHTVDGRFSAFGRLLEKDGYRVRGVDRTLSPQLLDGAEVFVIANAVLGGEDSAWVLPTPPAFTAQEIQALVDWVADGGSLLLIADHMPFPGSVSDLAAAFGVVFLNGYAKSSFDESGVLTFTRSAGSLADHPISRGRTESETVPSVKSFTGQAFRAVTPVQPLMFMPDDWDVFLPEDGLAELRENTPKVSARGLIQGAVLRHGDGRVAMFGEAAMFTAQTIVRDGTTVRVGMGDPEAAHNSQFVLNVMHWLSGLLDDRRAAGDSPADGPRPPMDATALAPTTFGTMGKQVAALEKERELELFRRDGAGVLTHMWFGGGFATLGSTWLRIYVDGERSPSIAMQLYPGHGIGFDDPGAPWGTPQIGVTGERGGLYDNYRIPFDRGIRITAQLDDAEAQTRPPFWWIVRGSTDLPVEIGGVKLPAHARLKLHRRENVVAQPLEEVELIRTTRTGALYQVMVAAESGNLSFMEGCVRAYVGGARQPLWLSSGLEDYFLGTYYFQTGRYHTPVAGLTHLDADAGRFSAYRFHDADPVFFRDGFRLTVRVGETLDARCSSSRNRRPGRPTSGLTSGEPKLAESVSGFLLRAGP